ncbi:Alpha-ketoglutarate-dependent dioxygenase abh1 [Exophiala dermatitidis]
MLNSSQKTGPGLHDAYARPPDSMRDLFKAWRKHSTSSLTAPDLIDTLEPDRSKVVLLSDGEGSSSRIQDLEDEFTTSDSPGEQIHEIPNSIWTPGQPFEIHSLPGLYVFPSLLTPRLQTSLLNKLLHRDLSNPTHRTNLHLHYDIPYPSPNHDAESDNEFNNSFFGGQRQTTLQPKDAAVHKPITYAQMLESKLRWMTLGGQYDWTNKVYPEEVPPAFPSDIGALLRGLFPEVCAQAAIVNLYTPGDTLSVHRDVSEECDRSLVSISIGCDAIFIAGNEDGSRSTSLRLRSGDAILMSGSSRYAWHAVPKILPDTCPAWLKDWPDIPEGSQWREWHGWMAKKRINLNVRQMKDEDD